MSRINIELTIDGDAEHAYRAIDKLLDEGVIQDAIDAVRVEGSRPVRVTGAIAVQVVIPRAVIRERRVDRGAAKMREVSNDLPPKSGEIGRAR